MVLLAIIIIYPAITVVSASFLHQDGTISLQSYQELFARGELLKVFTNTFRFVFMAVLLATVIGTTLAWLTTLADVPYARSLTTLLTIPMFFPALVSSIGWVFLAAPKTGLLNVIIRKALHLQAQTGPLNIYSLNGLTWVMFLYLVPSVYIIVSAAFRNMDSSLDEAGAIFGGKIHQRLYRLVFPLVRPAIISAAILIFGTGISLYAIPAIIGTTGGIETITTMLYRFMKHYPSRFDLGTSLANMLMLITFVTLFLQSMFIRKGSFVTISGKGGRNQRVKLGKFRYVAFVFILAYLVLTLILPLGANFLIAFLPYWTTDINLQQLSLDNFNYILFNYSTTWRALQNTVLFSITGAIAGTVIGSLVSYYVVKTTLFGKKLLEYVTMVPVAVSAIVFSAGLLLAFIKPPFLLYGTPMIMFVGYVALFLPQAVRSTASSLRQIGSELEEASIISGADWVTTFARVTLPLMRPALWASMIILFSLISRELAAAMLLYTPSTIVLPVALFDLWDSGKVGGAAALAIMLVIVSTGVALLTVNRGSKETV